MYSLSNCLGGSSVCFGSIETSKLSVSIQKRNNRNKLFRNKLFQNKPKKPQKLKKRKTSKFYVKNYKIYSLSNCFGWSSVCFGSFIHYRSETTETNVLFRIVPKLNQFRFQFRLFRIETSFEGHPSSHGSKLLEMIPERSRSAERQPMSVVLKNS